MVGLLVWAARACPIEDRPCLHATPRRTLPRRRVDARSRRIPVDDPRVEILGDRPVLDGWLARTSF
jgi:hypothetical protein